jgi:hypothetical protein
LENPQQLKKNINSIENGNISNFPCFLFSEFFLFFLFFIFLLERAQSKLPVGTPGGDEKIGL